MLDSSRALLLTVVTVGVLAAAACGGGRSGAPAAAAGSVPAPATRSGVDAGAELPELVLRPPALPAGYRVAPAQAHLISLAQETSNDSRRAAAIERATYLGGYQAGYRGPGIRLLVTAALVYASAASVHRVDTDPATLRIAAAQMNGHLVHPPRGAPGADPVLIEGSLPFHGRPLPIAYYIWRRGKSAFAVFLEGRRATIAEAIRLANLQDAQDRRLNG